jgi:ppGpp synthetase/RelA/SpoT-type nucleotidyltranferase
LAEQERVVASLRKVFPAASVVDRRAVPSNGYRAVHVVAQVSGTLVEIQVRSSLQHLWGEFSEKLADVIDPSIKYGGGPTMVRALLGKTSAGIAKFEETESQIAVIEADIIALARQQLPEEDEKKFRVMKQQVVELKESHARSKEQLRDALNDGIAQISRLKKKTL